MQIGLHPRDTTLDEALALAADHAEGRTPEQERAAAESLIKAGMLAPAPVAT